MSYPQPPRPDGSKKFLQLSGGALLATITGLILVCCIGPVALCFGTGLLGTILPVVDPVEAKSPGPPPTITIDACAIESQDGFNTAKITYTITNPGTTEQDYDIQLLVKNKGGAIVGDTTEYVYNVPGSQAVVKETTVYPDAAGGVTCAVGTVS